MDLRRLILIILFCLCITPFPAFAGDFDGSKPLAGSVDKILEISTKILESFPENQRALYSRALAYEKKGDLKQMSIDFEKMITFDPYNSIALNAYGYSLSLHEKQLAYAEKLIRKAFLINFSA